MPSTFLPSPILFFLFPPFFGQVCEGRPKKGEKEQKEGRRKTKAEIIITQQSSPLPQVANKRK